MTTSKRPAGRADTAVTTGLRPHLDEIDATLIARCMEQFDRILGAYDSDGWTLLRDQRLRQALTGWLPS